MSIQSGNMNSRKTRSIVVVEDDRLRDKLHFDLNKLGHEVEMFDPTAQFREHDFSGSADFCFVDSHLPERWDRKSSSDEPSSLTFITLFEFENGSHWEKRSNDFWGLTLGRSYEISELELTLHHAANMQKLLAKHSRNDRAVEKRLEAEIVGRSDAIVLLRSRISEAISNDKPVVLSGEQGTGKREIARSMHVTNLEANGSFIGYDCRCRPTNELLDLLEEYLRESDENLHNHQRNTVYVDRIEHISQRHKTRILEVFERLSSRVELILGSTTRESLQHREPSFVDVLTESLEAFKIELLPLRKRPEDIRLEARQYVEQVSVRAGVPVPRFSEDAFAALENYGWPGNSHELYSVCEQICSLISDGRITREIVLPWLTNIPQEEASTVSFTLREMEKRLIEATFHRFGGNREQTAGALKIGIRTLCGKLREYGYPPRGGPGSNRIKSQKAM